ncbi:MAG TPA: Rieske 2Fe-2S domain-containing protein [Actinomycetota bacterium]|jgi:cytochrome b6-f complex iron-sulfur subunit
MSTATIVAILVLLGIILFVSLFLSQSLRASRQAREAAEAAEPGAVPAKPVPAMSRRDFFRRSLVVSVLVFGAEFGAGTIAFLWPNLRGGFGSVITAGDLSELQAEAEEVGYVYNGAGRFYLVPWNGQPGEGAADYPAEFVTTDGLMPLYQRCVHLGCRVPFCAQSKWFECPCHGSKYNGAGEYQLGPAPRGLDRFKITVENDQVFVDTSEVILGPPRGTDTIDQPPQGPFCVAAG